MSLEKMLSQKSNQYEDRLERHLDVIDHDGIKGTDYEKEASETNAGEHHSQNLYDQDEDAAGETIDLSTGQKIDNSTYFGTENETLNLENSFDPDEEKPDRVGINNNDAAAKWLREHGG